MPVNPTPTRLAASHFGGVFAYALAAVFAVLAGVSAASAQPVATPPPESRPVTVTLVHLNDVYEILPVEGGKSGGLARVATVIRQLKSAQPALITTLGGDYLSPSALGTARVDGQSLAGRQMVDVLNAVGIDWATFGNHEFDVSEAAFRAHLSQVKFRLVSSNVTDAAGRPFPGVPTSAIATLDAGGRSIRIGLVAVTIDANPKDWVRYHDAIATANAEVGKLRGRVDAIVALTHLALQQDDEFVNAVPGIDLVLGGHEHENWLAYRGPRFTPIVKADANVRSLAIVTLTFGAPGTRPEIAVRLKPIDESVASAPDVDALARGWVERGFEAFRREGFAPETVVAVSTEPLDGRESTVRNRAGRLTDLIAAALAREAGAADVALFNGGSVRIDDVVPPGPVTEYDIIRVLPFGGKSVRATLDGALLARVLDVGENNQGLGGYLHAWGARKEGGAWRVRGAAIDPAARYVVAMPGFLLSGAETNLGFLTRAHPGVRDVQEMRDIRRSVIEELARAFPVR